MMVMKSNLVRPDIYPLRDRLLKLLLTALGAGVPTEPTLGALDPADLVLEVSLSLVAARYLANQRLTSISVKHVEKIGRQYRLFVAGLDNRLGHDRYNTPEPFQGDLSPSITRRGIYRPAIILFM